jgi:crotonobetainyl-CoA:carnitine CoA-transferase CaiB-like acyl-CoA transferase
MAAALEGIRVIDLTVWFQGPVAAQHLADFGAEVIKVERPQGGDQGRGVRSIKALPVADWNQYFLVINRNKKSIALDLKKQEGRDIMYRLVEKSDVFLSNMGIEVLENFDIGFDKLSGINPGLIYATNTGYGRFGGVTKPSFDMTVQALTGLMSRLGEPGQPPIYLGMGSGDAYGGLMSALGIMLALYHRRRTGKGQWVDASLYGAQLFLTAPSLQPFLATGDPKYSKQRSRVDVDDPLRNIYQARDKWIFLCMRNDEASWKKTCAGLDSPELAADARFADAEKRGENRRALVAKLDEMIAARSADEWMKRWQPAGVVGSPIGTLADLAADPQAWENDYFVKTHCEEVNREVDVRGLPIRLSKTPGKVNTLGPQLGQDTELFLTEMLGFTWEQIAEWKEAGVIP